MRRKAKAEKKKPVADIRAITELKRAEDELEKYVKDLERLQQVLLKWGDQGTRVMAAQRARLQYGMKIKELWRKRKEELEKLRRERRARKG